MILRKSSLKLAVSSAEHNIGYENASNLETASQSKQIMAKFSTRSLPAR
jgi:hypothetical protein